MGQELNLVPQELSYEHCCLNGSFAELSFQKAIFSSVPTATVIELLAYEFKLNFSESDAHSKN